MNIRQKITLYLLLYIVLCLPSFAQQVEIPDFNLRAAIADALGIPHGSPITQEDMNRLTDLDVRDQGIANLTGIKYATNLYFLLIAGNPITDLRPIAGLTQLERLYMRSIPRIDITPLANLTSLRTLAIASCDIVDISPLGTLTQLTELNLRHNQIIDISPLANLTNLKTLQLNGNRITDVTALAGLTNLEFLEIQFNQITDHSPIDGLGLSHFVYDETCELAPLPVRERIENRDYPSIFARWSGPSWPPIRNRPELSGIHNLAHHDLWFSVPQFGLAFKDTPDGFRMRGILDEAIRRRDEYLVINPNMIFLVSISMRELSIDAHPNTNS